MHRLMGVGLLVLAFGVESIATPQVSEPACLSFTVANPDGNYIVPGALGGIVYRRVAGEALRLDAWTPSRAGANTARRAVPLVLVIHGGGFRAGSRVAFVGQFLELLTTGGYAWASIDYRLGGPARVRDAEEDVRAAVAFARCHAGELGVDPDRVILLGEDTGAELAARVALAGTPGVIGAALTGGVYGAPGRAVGVGGTVRGGARAGESGTEVRPLRFAGAPPLPGRASPHARFLLVHGTSDTESPVAQAEWWCSGLRAAGGACDLVRVEGASHRPENWWPAQWGYKARLVQWLQAVAPTPVEESPRWRAVDLTKRLPPGLHKQIPYDSSEPSGRDAGHPAPGLPQHPTLPGGPPLLRTLDAWLPSDVHRRPAPAVVLLHGGGWEAGDRVTYITPLFEPLARAGLAWFSVDYRLTPSVQHPEQLDDARAAVAFIRRHAAVFGIDPRRLVLIGESASGQMVAMLAAEDATLAGAVSFYGIYDFVPMVTDATPRSLARRLFGRSVLDDDTRATLRKYSPLHQVGKRTVPMLLIHGTNERLWEQGVTMTARLGELGIPHELVRVEGAPHGMENWEGRPEWQSYKDKLVSWLRERLEAPR